MLEGGPWLAAFASLDIPGVVFTEPVVAWLRLSRRPEGFVVDADDRRRVRRARSYSAFLGYLKVDDTQVREALQEEAARILPELRRKMGLPPIHGRD